MRVYKVVILLNIVLGLGLLGGYLWWERENARLTRELQVAKQKGVTQTASDRIWMVKGIVRGSVPEKNILYITHDEIPGLMGASMTMAFPIRDPKLFNGLAPGDQIQFTLKETDNQIVVTAVLKEGAR